MIFSNFVGAREVFITAEMDYSFEGYSVEVTVISMGYNYTSFDGVSMEILVVCVVTFSVHLDKIEEDFNLALDSLQMLEMLYNLMGDASVVIAILVAIDVSVIVKAYPVFDKMSQWGFSNAVEFGTDGLVLIVLQPQNEMIIASTTPSSRFIQDFVGSLKSGRLVWYEAVPRVRDNLSLAIILGAGDSFGALLYAFKIRKGSVFCELQFGCQLLSQLVDPTDLLLKQSKGVTGSFMVDQFLGQLYTHFLEYVEVVQVCVGLQFKFERKKLVGFVCVDKMGSKVILRLGFWLAIEHLRSSENVLQGIFTLKCERFYYVNDAQSGAVRGLRVLLKAANFRSLSLKMGLAAAVMCFGHLLEKNRLERNCRIMTTFGKGGALFFLCLMCGWSAIFCC